MSMDPLYTPPGRKGTNPWIVFIFLIALGGAGAFLATQDIDWKEKFASLQQTLQQPPVQTPGVQPAAPAETAAIPPSFDAVSAEGGMLVAAGKAEPGATVLLQNGGQTLSETKADENGEWIVTLEKPLPPGPYDLSIMSIDPKTQKRLVSRRSYALTIAPQERKTPVQTASASAVPVAKKPGDMANVKRGDTLWGIAEHYYGKGMGARYPDIAGANKEQIKNPDLIYPNQQFALPEKKAP
jgi:nucleoid-associated protein YgaU